MFAALKILADVAIFRLKKLEMANMFAAVAIMFAIHLPATDMAVRFGFGLLLNLLAYLTNDYYDVDQDLASPNKDHKKARFLKEHMTAALAAQIALAVLLAAIGFIWSRGLVVALIAGAGICWVYSWKLKRLPYVDVLAMISWGIAMPLIGFPLDSVLGWCLVIQLALFSACFESIQIVRDYEEDVRSGVRTTAVRLGIPRTMILLRLFMVLSVAYAVLLLNRWFGLALLIALLLPFNKDRADVYWNKVRLVMGLGWLAMIGWIFWHGSSTGLLVSIGPEQIIPGLEWIR
ncbi:MAG: UbiA family prenyltransferase [Proteobacteria bacterium]|nr:UbiA family prenyltransferase [Pseudomonadota bacterium]